MDDRGFTLIETLVVVLIVLTVGAVAVPSFEAWRREAHVLGVARIFKGEFLKARSFAARHNTRAALRFERDAAGLTWYSTYIDGDGDGVLATDIRSGVDRRVAGPVRLTVPAQRVDVGVLPGIPAVPPDRGLIPTEDPIRFSHDTISFSPLGTATPGTFYLAGQGVQAAVRVNPNSARVRLMFWRGVNWVERVSAAGDARVLAAIHAWTAERAPLLERVVPPGATEGTPLLILGRRLRGAQVARFGSLTTWAVALSDTAAVAVVPAGAEGARVTLERGGLRSNELSLAGEAGPHVVRCDPEDGASNVWRDPVIVLRASHPLDRASLAAGAVSLHDGVGDVPCDLLASPDRRAVVIRPQAVLRPLARHVLQAQELRDLSGRVLPHHAATFTTGTRRWFDDRP